MTEKEKAFAFDQIVAMLDKGAILQFEKGIDRNYLVCVSGEQGFQDAVLTKAVDQASKYRFTPNDGSF